MNKNQIFGKGNYSWTLVDKPAILFIKYAECRFPNFVCMHCLHSLFEFVFLNGVCDSLWKGSFGVLRLVSWDIYSNRYSENIQYAKKLMIRKNKRSLNLHKMWKGQNSINHTLNAKSHFKNVDQNLEAKKMHFSGSSSSGFALLFLIILIIIKYIDNIRNVKLGNHLI